MANLPLGKLSLMMEYGNLIIVIPGIEFTVGMEPVSIWDCNQGDICAVISFQCSIRVVAKYVQVVLIYFYFMYEAFFRMLSEHHPIALQPQLLLTVETISLVAFINFANIF